MIQLENVSIAFEPGHYILKNVDLTMQRGETLVLVGPSGQGKSTVLKTIAGLVKPTTGTVTIDGVNIYEGTKSQRQEVFRRMGMLFQKNALFDSFSCLENLEFPMKENSELSKDEIKHRAKDFLEHVGLGHAAELYPDEISGGMQKRVGIARTLCLNPEIILYDDPTAGLDPITSKKIIELIISLKEEYNNTVVAVTNDMNRAFQMADRLAMVVETELIMMGSVQETLHYNDERAQQFIHGRPDGPLTQGGADGS